MPRIIHTFDTWFAAHETDLYYLGLKHMLSAQQMEQQDLYRDHDRIQLILKEWQARHLPDVETFSLAPAGWLEGAPPYLGLDISPEQVNACAAEYEDETGLMLQARPRACYEL